MSTFLVNYRHQGGDFCLPMPADNWEDAEAKLRSIGANGRVIGSDVSRIPVNAVTLPFAGPLARLLTWWRNLR